MVTSPAKETAGNVLREWRHRRRFSQLQLALEVGISTRHLSFVESGRSLPSRDLVLRLADCLELPLRERNRLLLAAGYAPIFPDGALGDPGTREAMAAVRFVLAAYEPYPALAVDRYWVLIAANEALTGLLAGVAQPMLAPPINVLRLSLSPDGLAPFILNLPQWRRHLLERLRREATAYGDPSLWRLHEELRAIRIPAEARPLSSDPQPSGIAVPLVLRHPVTGIRLSFVSTTTVFGTATSVALSELTLEGFLPADEETRLALGEKSRSPDRMKGEAADEASVRA